MVLSVSPASFLTSIDSLFRVFLLRRLSFRFEDVAVFWILLATIVQRVREPVLLPEFAAKWAGE